MNAYIWHDIKEVSSNYHSGGSVLIIAESLEKAYEIACYDSSDMFSAKKGEPKKMSLDKPPDFVFENVNYEQKVLPFPDTGCC